MEISLKDIIQALIKKWYIAAAIISVLVAIGTIIGVRNYRKITYTATASFVFSYTAISSTNITVIIGNCKVYLETDYITDGIKDAIEADYGSIDYDIIIEVVSSTMTISVTSENTDISQEVLKLYADALRAEDNKAIIADLSIDPLTPLSPPHVKESENSIVTVLIQIVLFGMLGAFAAGIIVITPLYSKAKKESVKE